MPGWKCTFKPSQCGRPTHPPIHTFPPIHTVFLSLPHLKFLRYLNNSGRHFTFHWFPIGQMFDWCPPGSIKPSTLSSTQCQPSLLWFELCQEAAVFLSYLVNQEVRRDLRQQIARWLAWHSACLPLTLIASKERNQLGVGPDKIKAKGGKKIFPVKSHFLHTLQI